MSSISLDSIVVRPGLFEANAPQQPSVVITGQPVVGNTLIAVARGYTPSSYQWFRCDSAGTNCEAIMGATSASYVVQEDDVGFTIVVEASPYASNHTAVVGEAGGGGVGDTPYWYEPFDGSHSANLLSQISAPQGGTPTGDIGYVSDGYFDDAIRLHTPGQSLGSGGRLAAVFWGASYAHSGYSGSGILGAREETFYRCRVRFPTGWQAASGTWNWWMEWHDDGPTMNELNSLGKPSVSCALGISSTGSTSPTPVGPGTSPKFVVQMNGGPTSSPDWEFIVTSMPVVTNHWYDVLCHFIWDERDANGFASVSIDGTTLYSQTRATLFRRLDGTLSYNTHGLYNYHLVASNDISIDFDEWYGGPSLSSVGG